MLKQTKKKQTKYLIGDFTATYGEWKYSDTHTYCFGYVEIWGLYASAIVDTLLSILCLLLFVVPMKQILRGIQNVHAGCCF